MPCENITPGLAITPALMWSAETPVMSGDFAITHVPTGRCLPNVEGCIDCVRAAGERLAKLGHDWEALNAENSQAFVDGLDVAARAALAAAQAISCRGNICGMSGPSVHPEDDHLNRGFEAAANAAIAEHGQSAASTSDEGCGADAPEKSDPVTAEDWQTAVDGAAGALTLDSALKYGLVTGGPRINVDRCEEILQRGQQLGYTPAKDAVERFVASVQASKLPEKG